MVWKLADAKNRFSEVAKRALDEGPQQILRRDDIIVVIAGTEYEKLSGKRMGFIQYLKSGPSFDKISLERDSSLMRDVEL